MLGVVQWCTYISFPPFPAAAQPLPHRSHATTPAAAAATAAAATTTTKAAATAEVILIAMVTATSPVIDAAATVP